MAEDSKTILELQLKVSGLETNIRELLVENNTLRVTNAVLQNALARPVIALFTNEQAQTIGELISDIVIGKKEFLN